MNGSARRKPEKVKLTKRLIDALKPPETGQIFLRDIAMPGFGLRLTRGSKVFILEKFILGRSRRMTIGPYGPITLEQARERAKTLIGTIATGRDPARELIDRKREMTFGDLEEMYRKRHLPRKKSAYNDERMFKTYLTGWKSRKLSSITRQDVTALHGEIGEKNGHYCANRVVALLRKMFNLAVHSWGVSTQDNPATRIELFREETRDRFIHPDELPRLMESLKQEPNLYIRGALFTCLLTGQRKTEVLSMKWGDVQLDQGVWRIPETKPGRPHLVPIPGPVRELLYNLPHTDSNPFVFVGRGHSHLTNISKAWGRIRTRANLQDARIHDLRRTLGSWLAGSGSSLPMIGRIMNHSQPSTTQIYARFDLAPIRQALEDNAARMLLIAAKAPDEGAT